MINIIAAVGKNLELGKDNNLIWHIPGDLKYFKEMTEGHTVVMGRRTFESIGKALPNRKNIVISHGDIFDKDIIVISNYKKVLDLDEDVFIIGGKSIYELFIPYADNLYLTEIDAEYEYADTYFPFFEKDLYDKEIIKDDSYNNINYSFVRYRKK